MAVTLTVIDTLPVLIAGDRASRVELLPDPWPQIAANPQDMELCASPDSEVLVQLAQLMHHMIMEGDVDEIRDTADPAEHDCKRREFASMFGPHLIAMLEYFANDWRLDQYPNYDKVAARIPRAVAQYEDRLTVVKVAEALFDHFGHHLPASFYWSKLAPIDREGVHDIVPLRLTDDVKHVARGWDSWLHAMGQVFPVHLTVQSISSEVGGMFELHGCACDHSMTSIGQANTSFHYRIEDPQAWIKWVRSTVWTAMWQYIIFSYSPYTNLITARATTS